MTPVQIQQDAAYSRRRLLAKNRQPGGMTEEDVVLERLCAWVESLAAVAQGDPLGEGIPADLRSADRPCAWCGEDVRSGTPMTVPTHVHVRSGTVECNDPSYAATPGEPNSRPVLVAIREDEETLAAMRTEREQ